MKNNIKILGLLPYFLVGILISGYFLLPNYAIAGQSSVTSVDGLALRIGSKADIIGDGFGNNGQADGGEVVLTGTDKKQLILSWESSKIRIVIGDVPTRQPITFTVRIPQDGKLVDSIPTEEKVIMSDKPLIGTHYFTNQYKYYLDQDDYFFITGNAFGPNRGTVVNLDLNKELNINEWSDGEVRVFPKQNIENLRLGANRFILRTANNHESEAFTITFERKIKPQCTSWIYSEWSACSITGQQTHGKKTRTIISSSPSNCQGGEPVLTQTCTVQKPPEITSVSPSTFTVLSTEVEIIGSGFGELNVYKGRLFDGENSGLHEIISWSDTKIKAKIVLKDWNKVKNSTFLYVKVKCLENDCSNYGKVDGPYGVDYVSNSFPISIDIPQCDEDKWKCGDWDACTLSGRQYRGCIKSFDCPNIDTPSPNQAQSCTAPRPACTEDKWECGNWGQCSLDGVKRRSCRRTFDCADVESDVPETSQSCNAPASPTRPAQEPQPVIFTDSIDRDQILRATVKLFCPIDKKVGKQGSGTVIDSYGSILTNRHVVEGTIGSCLVGFINNEDDTPAYTEVADVKNVSRDQSPNGDMAVVKIRNASKSFTAIDISQGNNSSLRSGDTILPFGYPREEDFGETITFTEGPYSGKGTTITVGGRRYDVTGFFKTTATIEHGNSGGGAYQKSTGRFMGIPTLGVNKVNYILSINTIKSWFNSFNRNYSPSNNNFSQISNYYSAPISIDSISLSELRVLDASKPVVTIYSDKDKRKLLTSKKGIYSVNTPTFFVVNNNSVSGYYFYFGTNKKADPAKMGRFSTSSEYRPPLIKKNGAYYFIFRGKDENGKIGTAVVTEYRYKK